MPSSTSPSEPEAGGAPLSCPRCATTFPLSERFCSECGMPLVYSGKTGEEPVTETHERMRKVKPQYSQGEAVKVGFARNQSEAELIQGLLLEEGIPSFLKRTRGFDVPDFLAAGPRDILVPESGAETARELLEATELDSEEREEQVIRDQSARIAGTGETPPGRLLLWVVVAAIAAAGIVWLLYVATG